MNRVFQITHGFTVRDGTIVYPFLNSKDDKSLLPWDLVNDVSLAIGDIAPNSRSKIHVHPLVTLITWVVSGELHIKMKDSDHPTAYIVQLVAQQAAISRPETFLQHINLTADLCRVLYIMSPAYLNVEHGEGSEGYADAVVIDLDWDELARQAWQVPALLNLSETRTARARAFAQLEARRAHMSQTE